MTHGPGRKKSVIIQLELAFLFFGNRFAVYENQGIDIVFEIIPINIMIGR